MILIHEEYQKAVNEIIQSIGLLIDSTLYQNTTKIYSGIVLSANSNNTWNIQYNGETHAIKLYGTTSPNIGDMVKVVIPQGNQALSWFFVGGGSGNTPAPVEGDKTYVFTQQTASNRWTVNHNLNKYPSVTVVDSGNNVVVGEVEYLSTNALTITFNSAFSGKAYMN